MKITVHHVRRFEAGSVLAITLVFGALIGLILLSYLELLHARTKIRARSLAWNQAIPVLEQGIEEAFTHLQDDSANLTTNSWTKSGSGSSTIYRKSSTNSDGSFFITTCSNVNSFPFTSPVIYSQGFIPAPLKQGYISRLVQVKLAASMTFPKSVSARGKIDLNGQSVVDSFDSSNTNYSTGGRYDPAKHKANGAVATDYNGVPAVDVGNGHIYGTVETGPNGTVAYNGSGTVGDLAWSSNHVGIEPGFTNNDMNVSFADNSAPAGWNSWPQLTTATGAAAMVGGTNYTYVVTGQVQLNGALNLNSHDTMVIVGNATLFVNGDFSVGTLLYIAPGATLKLYVAGNTTVSGGGVLNGTGLAASFSYYGLTNNTSIKYTGGADFIGTINAPEADFTLSGGGSVYGAAIVNTYTSKGSGAGLHYDEGASQIGPIALTSYREL
jgi:hypothetical protein